MDKLFRGSGLWMSAGKSLAIIIVAVAVIVVVAVWAGSIYFTDNNGSSQSPKSTQTPQATATSTPQASQTPTPTSTPIATCTVTGLNVQIQYANINDTYFGPVTQGLSLQQAYVGDGGQPVTLSFTLSEHAQETANHSINNITVATPGFTLVSINPNVPIDFSPGSSTVITVIVQSPNSDYSAQ